jgi:hypothetical protein
MSELQDALDTYDAYESRGWSLNRQLLVTIVEAARVVVDIHPSRLHKWHILHVKAGSWGLTHPLACDLTDCAYQDHAETWREQPDELGDYRWEHEPVLESWAPLTPGDTE